MMGDIRERCLLVLNKPHVKEQDCHCEACEKHKDAAMGFTCEYCGYKGRSLSMICQCYDKPCNIGTVGAGCPHGYLTCPICGDGEDMDPWAALRAIRAILTGSTVPSTTELGSSNATCGNAGTLGREHNPAPQNVVEGTPPAPIPPNLDPVTKTIGFGKGKWRIPLTRAPMDADEKLKWIEEGSKNLMKHWISLGLSCAVCGFAYTKVEDITERGVKIAAFTETTGVITVDGACWDTWVKKSTQATPSPVPKPIESSNR